MTEEILALADKAFAPLSPTELERMRSAQTWEHVSVILWERFPLRAEENIVRHDAVAVRTA